MSRFPQLPDVARLAMRFLRGAEGPGTTGEGSTRWRRFGALAPALAYGAIGLLLLATVILNPFGNFPQTPLTQRFAHSNQRYSYPSIVRSGAYDSAVFGTSTARLLQPADLDRAFGGRFAALAMDSGSAYEQTALARLFLAETTRVGTLILSLDGEQWCGANPDATRVTFRLFPESFYDSNAWNDVSDILNLELPDALRRAFNMAIGEHEPYFDASGFGDFTGGEANYDPQRARANLSAAAGTRPSAPPMPGAADTYRFPALRWLRETLGHVPPGARVILARMPINVVAQPAPGSEAAQRDAACLAEIAAIGRDHGAAVLDFSFPSPITSEGTNYWDPVHYRLPIGSRIVAEMAEALRTFESTPTLRVLAPLGPRPGA